MSVNDLASRLAVSPGEVIRALFVKGVMAQMNQQLDRDAVRVVAEQFGVMVVDEEGGGGTDAAKVTRGGVCRCVCVIGCVFV